MDEKNAKFRAGDVVRHRPSGEEWVVCCTRGADLIPAGWPPSAARMADCELIIAATDAAHRQMLLSATAAGETGIDGVRYIWAVANLIDAAPLEMRRLYDRARLAEADATEAVSAARRGQRNTINLIRQMFEEESHAEPQP